MFRLISGYFYLFLFLTFVLQVFGDGLLSLMQIGDIRSVRYVGGLFWNLEIYVASPSHALYLEYFKT